MSGTNVMLAVACKCHVSSDGGIACVDFDVPAVVCSHPRRVPDRRTLLRHR